MTEQLKLAVYAYCDSEHESVVEFYDDFEQAFPKMAAQKGVDIEGRVLRLTTNQKISYERGQHSDFQPGEIGHIGSKDIIWDRSGTMIRSVGSFLDIALFAGAQILNYPISIDESKSRDYAIAKLVGFNVPKTIVFPEAYFMKTRPHPENHGQLKFDIDLEKQLAKLGKGLHFFKRAHGGGRQKVFEVKDKSDLFNRYMEVRHDSMVLQERIEFEHFVRTFVFGEKVIHTDYDIKRGPCQSYKPIRLSKGDEKYLNFATVELSRRLATPFCTMEIAKRKNSIDWYFIDITNGCNFDMRPCELAGIYEPVRNLLIEQLIDWAQTPRPMLVNTSIQDIVTKRQLFRADLKGQDAKLLKEFAKEHGIRYTGKEFQSEKKEFIDKYHKLHD